MLQSSERERERVKDELTRELAEAHRLLKQKVTKHSNNMILMDADCRKKCYNPVRERNRQLDSSW